VLGLSTGWWDLWRRDNEALDGSMSTTTTTTNVTLSSSSVALSPSGRTASSSSSSSSRQQLPAPPSISTTTTTTETKTNDTIMSTIRYDVCFITSVFASSPEHGDRPPTVVDFQQAYPNTIFAFYAYTNLPPHQLDAPGWTIRHRPDLAQRYRRYITQSRWAKFMAWTDPSVKQSCRAIFYLDGFCQPKLKHAEWYRSIAQNLSRTVEVPNTSNHTLSSTMMTTTTTSSSSSSSSFGLAQNKHLYTKGGGVLHELQRIVDKQKDIAENVQATLTWLQAQPDFRDNCTMYDNHYIAYNPRSIYFQTAATFFWNHYSLELDSWRDQPLWCYVLDRYHITPTPLGKSSKLFVEKWKHMAKGGHRYDKSDNNDKSNKNENAVGHTVHLQNGTISRTTTITTK
jgi:hypothetical protein